MSERENISKEVPSKDTQSLDTPVAPVVEKGDLSTLPSHVQSFIAEYVSRLLFI